MEKTYQIKGMHCRSCEVLLENSVKGVPGVKKVFASNSKGQITVYGEDFSDGEIVDAVKGAGYEVGKDNLPLVNLGKKNIYEVLAGVGLVVLIFIISKAINFDRIFLSTPSASGLGTVFVIGLTAGLSTCMALIGGLVLGVSARFAETHPDASSAAKFKPHLYFNLGRIVFFIIMGALLGTFGSALKITGSMLGFLTIAAGILMFVIGIQLLEIFPRFNFSITMPKFLSKILKLEDKAGSEYSHKKSMLLGAGTFFLPCGFTQAMQIYAVSTGSATKGAAILGIFALGTSVGLLGLGGIVSTVKKNSFGRIFFKAVGILVIVLAVYNIGNGIKLAGLRNFSESDTGSSFTPSDYQTQTKDSGGTIGPSQPQTSTSGELKVFEAFYDPKNYSQSISPNKFQAKIGDVVRIEIMAKGDGVGCMGSVMIPGLVNQPQYFVGGEKTTLEFQAKKPGKFLMTCAMGVQSGIIEITK